MQNKIALVVTFTTLFFIFFIPLRDTDFGWHIRCGEEIIKQGKLCSINNFTTLLKDYRWYSPSHGYQILLYLIFSVFGFFGLSLFYAVSAATVFTLLISMIKGPKYFYLVLLTGLLLFSWGVLGLGFRSQILSVYFLSLAFTISILMEKNFRFTLLFIPLMVIWANTHPGFFVGDVFLILMAIKYIIYYLKKEISMDVFSKVFFMASLSITVTLLNPFAANIYQEVFQHTRVPLNTLIAEWVAPPPWQVLMILVVLAVTLALLLVFHSDDLLRGGFLIFAALISLEARRNLPLFSVALVFALSDKKFHEPINRIFNKFFQPEVFVGFFALVFLTTVPGNVIGSLRFSERDYCQKALTPLPCKAVDFLKKQSSGNIFNTYEWGGYLIWKLPNFKIFVDGRMPSWDTFNEMDLPANWRGKSPYTIYLETLQNKPGWEDVIGNYKTDYLLIQGGTFMDILLKPEPQKYGFKESYRDETAVVYSKTKPEKP